MTPLQLVRSAKMQTSLHFFSSLPIVENTMRLSSKALGYATAVIAAGFWLVAMGFSLFTGVGHTTILILGGLHPFFHYSWSGLLIIVIEHLIGGFIVGWLFGWLYNKFVA